MADIKMLKIERCHIKDELIRLKNYFYTIDQAHLDDRTITQLEMRLDKVEPVWDEFKSIQLKIEYLLEDDIPVSELSERQDFENIYFSTISDIKTCINQFRDEQRSEVASNRSSVITSGTGLEGNLQMQSIKLPTIKLPTFKGSYDTWVEYKDAFQALVHNNQTISDIQKFYYLRSTLEQEALEIIQSIEVSAKNYKIAWGLLEDRFDNKKLIIHNHVKAIFDAPCLIRESHVDLRKLFDNIIKNLRSLKSLGEETDKWDTLIIYIIVSKLDPITRRDWESQEIENELPRMSDMNKFLKSKCEILEKLEYSKIDNKNIRRIKAHTSSTVTVNKVKCYFCKEEHAIYKCESFLKLDVNSRIREIKALNLCLNCLRPGHSTQKCFLSSCRKCNKKHNTFLHAEKRDNPGHSTQVASPNQNNQVNVEQTDGQVVTAGCVKNDTSYSQVLLSTAMIAIKDSRGKNHQVRALLDNGSQSNFISENLCHRLSLPKTKAEYAIMGVGQALAGVKEKTVVTINSLNDNFSAVMHCLILPKITGPLPNNSFNINNLNLPANIKLADPTFNTRGPIDLLIGASIFWDLVSEGQVRELTNCAINCNVATSSNSIDEQLTKFWQVEECLEVNNDVPDPNDICELHFANTFKRDSTGRFVVSIPFKKNVSQLGESKERAMERFYSLEKRLNKDLSLKADYINFMNEYERLGHMSIINSQDTGTNYFLPHHAVRKDSSITTKVRVVFDASMKTDSGLSLNDVQYSGPTIQNDLFSIILRFRKYQFVVTADISKMYRQVLINSAQRRYQNIFWRSHTSDELKCYQLNTVTYGTSSAPFLAVRCLYQLGTENETNFPITSNIIKNDFYMDDLLTGCDNADELLKIQGEITNILASAGFELRKWLSNDRNLSSQFQFNNDLEASILHLGEDQQNKTLGILWNSIPDIIQYSINDSPQGPITKRSILSNMSQIFDPLGLLSPVTIVAKLIMQGIWQARLPWDERVPSNIATKWTQFRSKLNVLNKLEVPRCILLPDTMYIELHGFTDASERAYGCCIYVRSKTSSGFYNSQLICAKSRVAPLKQITLPRLELCGAVLLSRLVQKVRQSLKIKFNAYYYWCDSTITLCWLRAPPRKWKTFVANRVSVVQLNTNINDWYHVRSHENPADLISRGIDADSILPCDIWWKGPAWFSKDNSEWTLTQEPIAPPEIDNFLEQRSVSALTTTIYSDFSLFSKFSSLVKLQRTLAYCLRFINNLRSPRENRRTEALSVFELDKSLQLLIKIAQTLSFPNDIDSLSRGKVISKKSSLLSLHPFLDNNGILRVGGRIQNSTYKYDKKHPMILPRGHSLTKLIFRNEHLKLLHCGAQQLLASIRERYWPIAGRNIARYTVQKCITCFRVNPNTEQYRMGNLPFPRINQFVPFDHTGIDYAGPILIKDRKLRRARLIKAYICIFICLSTKCVHLELVTDLTTDSFLNTLKRFIGRRGKPSNIYSDNGTTFVGASSQLKEFARFLNSESETIVNSFSEDNISWHFIPPRAPNFGGLWEAGIKSMKYHLKRIVGNANLNFEDLLTILVQIEAILNSRPLCPLSSDPIDPTPLTPAHFLIGKSLTAVPEPSILDVNESRLSKYQRQQQLVEHFWRRWHKEYISELQVRTKWKTQASTLLKTGSLVIVKEEQQPPLKWKLGRIIKLHMGDDYVVRVVDVQVQNTVVTRAVSKVCVLPLTD